MARRYLTRQMFVKAHDEPYVPPKNPFQTFLLGLALVGSLPLLQGDSGSAALEKALPNITVIMWGYALLIGCSMSLVGMWIPDKHRVFGLNIERSGMILTGGAALIYAWVVWGSSADPASIRYAISTQTAFGLACVWRVFQVTKALRWSLRTVGTQSPTRKG